MEKVYNLDIRPRKETCDLYPSISPLLRNDALEATFDRFEAEASAAKQGYHFWGRIAILLIAFASIYALAEALVLPDHAYAAHLALFAAATAASGVGLQIYLVVSKLKHRWLLNRFGAERLRSIKFQAFTLATSARDAAALKTAAEQYYTDATTRLTDELTSGARLLERFSPISAVKLGAEATPPTNQILAAEALQAYLDLRVQFQARFAGGEIERLKSRERVTNSSSDMIYLLAAALVTLALLIRVGHFGSEGLHHAIDFAAVALFVVSLSIAVLEHASIDLESRSRYELYEAHMEEMLKEATAQTGASVLGTVVRQGELGALGELAEFCRSAARITYRI